MNYNLHSVKIPVYVQAKHSIFHNIRDTAKYAIRCEVQSFVRIPVWESFEESNLILVWDLLVDTDQNPNWNSIRNSINE